MLHLLTPFVGNKMMKIITVVTLFVMLFVSIAPVVLADNSIDFNQNLDANEIKNKAGEAIYYLRLAALILAVVAVILFGASVVFNNEDPRMESQVKNRLLWVAIGVAIIALAVGIVSLVFKTFSGGQSPF